MTKRILTGLTLVFTVFLMALSQVPVAQTARGEFETERQTGESALHVSVHLFMPDRYGFFDTNVHYVIAISITMNLAETPTTPHVLYIALTFSLTEVSGLPEGAYYTYGFWGYPPVGIVRIYLPENTSQASIQLRGRLSGSSFLWRNAAEVVPMNVTSSLVGLSPSYELIMVPPPASRVLRVFQHRNPDLRYRETHVDGQRIVSLSNIHSGVPVVVLYEPGAWEKNAITLMIVTVLTVIFIVYAVPHALNSRRTNSLLSRLSSSKLIAVLKRRYHKFLEVDSSKLLMAFILCGLLMVSLSFAAGPDPRLKAYVLSSTRTNAKDISEFIRGEGGVAISIFDEMNEFETLTILGVFSTAVVGDFYPPTEEMVKTFVYPALDSVPRIIILKPYAFEAFSQEIQRRYFDKTVVAEDLDGLRTILRRTPRRANVLGLKISPELYEAVSATVGTLSFIIVFLGLAFLSSKLIEVGKKPGAESFPEAIAYAVSYYVFTQTIYIVCGVLLAMPLGLHTSSAKVTAIGFLGFGGGSRPRMLAGMAGFLLGSLVSLKEGPKLDRVGLLSFLVVGFFILMDPFTNGVIFYELLLIFTVGPRMEQAYIAWSYTRGFIGSVAYALGGWVSPVYAISTGAILYYAGVIPFCLSPKLNKKTATVLLLFSAFCVSRGGIRVADTILIWKTFASVIPGITVGLFFTMSFLFLSFIETVVKEKIGVNLHSK